MTRSWVQLTPSQWQGEESDSDQVERERVGSEETADLRARRERPSELRAEEREKERNRRRKRRENVSVIMAELECNEVLQVKSGGGEED